MPLFRVLPKVSSFRFKDRRFVPGDVVEFSAEEAARFNLDCFVPVKNKPAAVVVAQSEEKPENKIAAESATVPPEPIEAKPVSERHKKFAKVSREKRV